ncbi:BEN domain-containing protein 5-like [Ornithodoros turicata]|uniref:BEN domain-containing protein 5-like n=1 Tax=Ornithodoros turicata TaxID=34597 RepID=UPI0031397E53
MTDIQTATEIMNDPSIVESLVGRTFEITWKSGEPPAKAHLIAAGDPGTLERRRNRLAARACKNMSQASGCCGHEEQIKQLQQANDDLKRKIEDLENMMDIQKTVKTLKRIVRNMKASQEERPVLEPNQVDLGSGVYVSSATLTRLQESYKDSPSKFARALTRVLFTDEELKNRSLFGKQSNSHKNKDPRPALDENRVTAILEHTCATFKCADYLVKRSLSAMLQKLNKGTP